MKMNEINRLWDKWAKDHEDEDVDAIIVYYRKQLALYDAGIKPKKAEAENVDMSKIIANIKQRTGGTVAPTAKPTKSSGKGIRRI
jgi:hypothetical protein